MHKNIHLLRSLQLSPPKRVFSARVVAKYLSNVAYSAPFPRRSHTCGELCLTHAGTHVVLAGWLLPERKVSKSISFFPIRDSYGTTQLVVHHEQEVDSHLSTIFDVPLESTVLIEGEVCARPERNRRPEPTGDIEVRVNNFILLNPADRKLPFIPSSKSMQDINELLRARYRYLDLRRPELSQNLRRRGQVSHIVRNLLHDEGFIEVETPMLLKSTPEGAREFLVPTRIGQSASRSPEKQEETLFYALPQSPQQPKQLLICSGGIDKYYQIARCFRDEGGRQDRQPEFTQIDLEMAFVSWGNVIPDLFDDYSSEWRIGGNEVRDVIETLIRKIWKDVEGVNLPDPFEVKTYREAMARYGSDKPDLRNPLEIIDLASFPGAGLENGIDSIDAIILRQHEHVPFLRADKSCRYDDEPDVTRIAISEGNLTSWLSDRTIIGDSLPLPSAFQCSELNKTLRLNVGDSIWLARRPRMPTGGSTVMGRIRLRIFELARELKDVTVPDTPRFVWITEFPLFTRADREKDFLAQGRWSSSHHPFTAPMWQDIEAMYDGRIEQVRGQHYDLVLNGVEIGGGSVRVHDYAMQEHIFREILQLSEAEKESFGHLLHALKCGAPPHGGIALGFDRLMSILCKTQSIRDVIAFPKSSAGTDLLFKSPTAINESVLHQYGIRPR